MNAAATPEPANRPDGQRISEVVDLDVLRNQPAPVDDVHSENLSARKREVINRARVEAHEAFLRQIVTAQNNMAVRLADIDERERALLRWCGQPVVLVRTTLGAALRVYHDANNTCGLVTDRHRFDEMFEGEAKARGLRCCSICRTR